MNAWLSIASKRYRDHVLALGTTVGVALAIAAGCSGADRADMVDQPGGPIGLAEGPCDAGQERICGVTLEQENGVATCYRGTQVCEEGTWSGCQDGRVTKELIPDFSDARFKKLSLSLPASCGSVNVCDPGCMYFDEDPTPDVTTGMGGPGMGGVPDWGSPPGAPTCAHGLCETGVALDPACIPCAATVCATDPTCCTGTGMTDDWDGNCVDLVYTACAGDPLPPNICDYAAFGETNVRLGNASSGYPTIGSNGNVTPEPPAQVGSIFAKGLVDIRNANDIQGSITTEGNVWFEDPSTVTGNITAGGWVTIRNNAEVGGDITAGGYVYLESWADVLGDVWAGSYVELRNNAEIAGDSRSVGNLQGQAGSIIGGSAYVNMGSTITGIGSIGGNSPGSTTGTVNLPPAVSVELPTLAAYERDISSSCAVAAGRPGNATPGNKSVSPGIYGNYTMDSGHLVLASGGAYVFNNLTWFSNSGIRLQGTGPWEISVCNRWNADTNFTVYLDATTTLPDPEEFIVYADQTAGECIHFGPGAIFNGIYIAPKCDIRVKGGTSTAALWSQSVWTDNSFNLQNIPFASCDATDHFGGATCDGTTALYTDGSAYAVGNRVHYADNIYECIAAACATGGGLGGGAGYWPGEGASWATAWTLVGPCPADPSVNECPVSIVPPGTPGPYEPCYEGLQCQVNSRCTEVLTDASCEHHKCAEGPALTDGCDDCVTRICDAPGLSYCCSGTWDAACVEAVATVCDAECGAATAVGCEHDVCETGVPLTAACHADVNDVCTTAGFAYCCDQSTGVWDQACVDELFTNLTGSPSTTPAFGESACDYAVMGNGSAALYSTYIEGNVGWFGGTLTLFESWPGAGNPTVTGNLYHANGAVNVHAASIWGDFVVNGGVSAVSSSTIGGNLELSAGSSSSFNSVGGSTIIPNTTVPVAPPAPTFTMTCPSPGPFTTVSGFLPAGTYAGVGLGGNLTLEGGDYYFDEFFVYNHTLNLPADGSPVNIYVCSNFETGWGGRVISPTGDSLQLHVFSQGGVINIGGNSTVYGIYTTGRMGGTTTIEQDARVYGMVHGYHSIVQTQKGVRIDAGGFTRDDCINRGIDPGAVVTPCPTTTPLADTIAESGTCVDNGATHQVTSSVCADVDLAVDISCGDDLIVCNHGNSDVPANEAELFFYPRAGQQFATETPDPGWSVGSCVVSQAIPAGTCVTETCSATLVDEDLTVRAALTSGASVSECSTLDNWGYFVDAYTCSGPSVPVVVIEDYEATCPDDAYASWGLLTWNADTPGTSSITFEARTSYDGTFSGAYTPLETADTASGTTSCGVGTCAVDLYGELFPGGNNNEPSHVQLRITLNPVGSDAPTLEDWRVTYTCVVDQ